MIYFLSKFPHLSKWNGKEKIWMMLRDVLRSNYDSEVVEEPKIDKVNFNAFPIMSLIIANVQI